MAFPSTTQRQPQCIPQNYGIRIDILCLRIVRVVLGKAVFWPFLGVLKKIYQLYQNKNGTSGKEKEFYIR